MKRGAKEILKKIASKLSEVDELLKEIKTEVVIKTAEPSGTGGHVYVPKEWCKEEVAVICLRRRKIK